MRIIMLLTLLATSGCALSSRDKAQLAERKASTQQQLETVLAGLTRGRTETCLSSVRRTYDTQRIGDTILYKVNRNLIYRNDTTGGCSNGRPDDILVTSIPQPGLCRGDIVRTFEPYISVQTGSCGLGDFVAYERKK